MDMVTDAVDVRRGVRVRVTVREAERDTVALHGEGVPVLHVGVRVGVAVRGLAVGVSDALPLLDRVCDVDTVEDLDWDPVRVALKERLKVGDRVKGGVSDAVPDTEDAEAEAEAVGERVAVLEQLPGDHEREREGLRVGDAEAVEGLTDWDREAVGEREAVAERLWEAHEELGVGVRDAEAEGLPEGAVLQEAVGVAEYVRVTVHARLHVREGEALRGLAETEELRDGVAERERDGVTEGLGDHVPVALRDAERLRALVYVAVGDCVRVQGLDCVGLLEREPEAENVAVSETECVRLTPRDRVRVADCDTEVDCDALWDREGADIDCDGEGV